MADVAATRTATSARSPRRLPVSGSAGTVVHAEHGLGPVLGRIFAVGDTLGYIGTGCFLAASVLITAAIAWQVGWRALPGGVLLVAASISFVDSHIFWPRGVFTMLGIAAGVYLLSVTRGFSWWATSR